VTTAAPTDSAHLLETIEPPPAVGPTPVPRRLQIAKKTLTFVILPAATPPNTVTFVGDGRVILPPAPTPAIFVVEGPVGVASPNQITVQADSNGRVRIITPVAWN